MASIILGILPAPNNIQYSEEPAGHLQIFWEPPTLVSDKLGSLHVSIDSRITHFEIYIITEESTIVQVYNASGTSFSFENGNISCSFWFQVAAVNPAGVGEHSPPQNLDCEFAYDYYMMTRKNFLHIREIVVLVMLLFSTVYNSTCRMYRFHKSNYRHDRGTYCSIQ